MLRTTLFAPFVDSNHRAIFKMTLIEKIAQTYKGTSNFQIIKHLKLATKEKTTITCVSQEKMHVQTEGVAAPPDPALMALLQGLGDESRLLLERLE
ncbi:hypothetical protein Taro_050470 [Colocasia esculenta]|uniref:Uncharacterized protein n=1 Tax=Colocasia esculenta TaxID=4460 RepID=A0A843XE89_COLES|nr:hypothetical protein [Colocasia esculenta]